MNLEQILSQVSKNCLRGQPVPHDLALLWKTQLDGDQLLTGFFPVQFVHETGDSFFEGYRESDGIPVHIAEAYRKMFEQIAFVAKTEDGALIGYWLGEEARPVAQSPVVELDNEGQFSLKGISIAHYFLEMTDMDSPQEFSKVKNWLEKFGIPVSVRNHDEIWALTEHFDDPNELSWSYQAS